MDNEEKGSKKLQLGALLKKRFGSIQKPEDEEDSDEEKIGKSVQSGMDKSKAKAFMKGFKKG